jgi:hypothetical protein
LVVADAAVGETRAEIAPPPEKAMTLASIILVAAVAAGPPAKPEADRPAPEKPVRVADVISGHIHPALAVTKSGALLAVYNKQGGGGKELLLCRSTDGGRTWTKPVVVPGIKQCAIYPGSLTVLSDGRIVLAWACYRGNRDPYFRTAHYMTSADEGFSWSEPHDLPLADPSKFTALRYPLLELAPQQWVWPLYDRTIVFDEQTGKLTPFGDGRDHGMVPIVRTLKGTLVSGAPYERRGALAGKPGKLVRGLRSTDGGLTWQALNVFPPFGVAGYDLTPLADGRVVLTSIIYENPEKADQGELAYAISVSRDDGQTWDTAHATRIYDPGRRIPGRGWPRTVLIDKETLGTLFFDLDAEQPGGPGVFFIRTPLAALAN